MHLDSLLAGIAWADSSDEEYYFGISMVDAVSFYEFSDWFSNNFYRIFSLSTPLSFYTTFSFNFFRLSKIKYSVRIFSSCSRESKI
jgi:hypothetical protein